MKSNIRLELKNISKDFGPTRALDNVNLKLEKGEIHAILGQNGAGKSTLVKILAGVHRDFSGEIWIDERKQSEKDLISIYNKTIGVVYQEFPLIPHLTVAENIFLDRLPKKKILKSVNWKQLYKITKHLLEDIGLTINPKEIVANLNMGNRQLISIARALSTNPDILLFDEATSTLNDSEVDKIFNILRLLREKGVSVIYISHKIEEIFNIADRITVLRDGQSVDTVKSKGKNKFDLIQMMAGRDLSHQFPIRENHSKDILLEIKDFSDGSDENHFNDCNFFVKAGEIIGIAGLVGSGRTEMLKAIFGAHERAAKSKIMLNGKMIKIRNPRDAINNGIYYITSDRRKEGLISYFSIKDNMSLGMLKKYTRCGYINQKKEKATTNEYINKLSIKTIGYSQLIKELSGGNQQKVIMSRWLSGNGKLFLFDEPTRGLDVGVKYDVYNIMIDLVKKGNSILMICSELPELMAMSDRILIMSQGKIVAQLDDEEADQEKILAYMMDR